MVTRIIILSIILALTMTNYSPATTYYVKIGGNDGAAGTSWATAWATTGKVQTSLAGGDTVYFGTGTWYDVHIRPPKGSASDRTCFACSSFVQGIAHLWGSQHLTGWTVHSGNIWKIHFNHGPNCWGEDIKTLAQNDTLLKWQTSLSGVTSAGRFYYAYPADTVYAWCYGNANPNNVDMEGSCHEVFDFATDANGYTTVWGFDIRYGKQGIILFNGDGGTSADSVLISHCNISGTSNYTTENPSAVISYKSGSEYTPSTWGKDNEIRACTLSNFVDWYQYNHGDGVCIYTQTRFIVDSCYIDGRGIGNVGIIFKNETQGCVARFNTLKNINENALRVAYSGQADSFYGNIIWGNGSSPTDGANLSENPQSNPWYSNSCVWLNNTFYNCNYLTGLWSAEDGGGTGHKFKYNIQYKPTSTNAMSGFDGSYKARWTIDSNLIYRSSFGSGSFYYQGSIAFATWRTTEGFDTNSDTVYSHVGFNNPTGGDFSRPSSSQEMNLTYGGKTWTRYGAWQPSETPGADFFPPDTVRNVVCYETTTTTASFRCHKNDSTDCAGYMVRYATGGTSPASYSAGTFGNSTSSRNDTTFTVTGLSASTQYSFSIFARDEVPNWSAKGSGSSKTVTTKQQLDITPPDTVKAVDTIQVNTTSVLLKCHRNDSTDCVGYRVKYNQGSTAPANVNSGTYGDSSDANGRNDTLFTVSGLTTNTQYSFSVFAKDEVSNWSVKGSGSWKTVTTDLNPDITPPDTVKGVDTITVTANQIYLKYHRNDSADCSGYMVRHAFGYTAPPSYNSGTFGDSTSSRSDTTLIISGLSSNTQYSFTVFAHDEVPNWTTKGSQSSMTVRTRAENHCPTTPIPDLPADGDTILGTRPILSVNNSVDTEGDILLYDFQVCSDSQMTDLAANGTDVLQGEDITYWQTNNDLLDERWFWWKARSYDGVCYSDWSGERKFYAKRWIAEVEDSQPTLKSPTDGATLKNSQPVLEVYNITGFESLVYYFQLDSDTQFVNPARSGGVVEGNTITSWMVANSLSEGSYCWRARAFDGSNFSRWSEAGRFTLAPEIYVYPNPFKPSTGDENIVFANIPIGSDIKIVTLDGKSIKKFADTRESQIVWDVKNQKNEDVASGVYLYFVDFPGGSTSGKIVVIR